MSAYPLDDADPIDTVELSALVQSSSDAMFTCTLDGTVLTWNRGAERLFGYRASEMIGRSFRDLVPEDRIGEHEWIVESARKGRTLRHFETQRRRADGSPVQLSVTVSPLRDRGSGPVTHVAVVSRDISAIKIAERSTQEALRLLGEASRRDSLTGVASRRHLTEILNSHQPATPDVALFLIDIDDFNGVNNLLGYTRGDEVLKEVADRLVELIGAGGIVARTGGDEFAVLVHGNDARQEAGLAERIVCGVGTDAVIDGHHVAIRVNVGVASGSGRRAVEGRELLHEADLALLEVKASRQRRWQHYEPRMREAAATRSQLETELSAALAAGRFELLYQPVCDTDSGEISSVEALLRWWHPSRGMVPPSEFIPVAERSGQIVEIGDWVLRTACDAIAGLAGCRYPPRLAVNVSARQLAEPRFVGAVIDALQIAGMPPDQLTLEITETIVAAEDPALRGQLSALRGYGIGLAIDDFGTGYSSLARLHALPFTSLKIDKSLTDGIVENRSSHAIVRSVAAMAHDLGMTVVAEGVEHTQQLTRLSEIGCDFVQGFLLHRPMSLDDLRDLLQGQ